MPGSDAVPILHISSGRPSSLHISSHKSTEMQFCKACSGLSRTAMSRCGVWTHELTSMGTVEACTDREWDRQAQTGRKHSTVQSPMAHRHCCVMCMDALQTQRTLTARLNNSLSTFIEKEMRHKRKKECACPCVGQQGRIMVILQARYHTHCTQLVSMTKTLYSSFCVNVVMITKFA